MDKPTKTYRVYHDADWPQGRINETLGGHPASQFPEHFIHVANVQATGLREAVELTTDKGGILDDTQPWVPWEKNGQAEALVKFPRDTVPGDVVVDPQGKAYRIEDDWFTEIQPAYDAMKQQVAGQAPRAEQEMER